MSYIKLTKIIEENEKKPKSSQNENRNNPRQSGTAVDFVSNFNIDSVFLWVETCIILKSIMKFWVQILRLILKIMDEKIAESFFGVYLEIIENKCEKSAYKIRSLIDINWSYNCYIL